MDNNYMLTVEQIMSLDRFREAVVVGGMDRRHYAILCGMAMACIALIKDDPDFVSPSLIGE